MYRMNFQIGFLNLKQNQIINIQLGKDMNLNNGKVDEEEFEIEAEMQDQNPEEDMKINEGTWTLDQNKNYVFFMTYFKEIFVSKERRKSLKIFKFLSSYLQSRTARQCRSHFQKLINKHKTIHKLKNHFRNEVGKPVFDQQYKQFCTMIEANPTLNKLKYKEDDLPLKEMQEKGIQTEQPINPNMVQQQWGAYTNNQNTQPKPMNGIYGLLIFPHPQNPSQPKQ